LINKQNIGQILGELPAYVQLVAAAKTRGSQEIQEVIEAGVRIIGENYVQEAERVYRIIGNKAQWHFIGHLQKNKVKKAVEIFDMIETVDSIEIAGEIDKRSVQAGKIMPVLIEINSGREPNKTGVPPDKAEQLITALATFKNIKVSGLMTMGPAVDMPEDIRPYFRETKRLFDRIKNINLPNIDMKYLSMGMTDSYLVAIEEGANIVRIGSKIFGERG
jgi:pyridoxal phosphate enzyme (YggS family)